MADEDAARRSFSAGRLPTPENIQTRIDYLSRNPRSLRANEVEIDELARMRQRALGEPEVGAFFPGRFPSYEAPAGQVWNPEAGAYQLALPGRGGGLSQDELDFLATGGEVSLRDLHPHRIRRRPADPPYEGSAEDLRNQEIDRYFGLVGLDESIVNEITEDILTKLPKGKRKE